MRQGQAAVLDVRGVDEHASSHFPAALNIAHTRLLDRLEDIPAAEELVVYCASGNRAAAASALLAREGHSVRYVDDVFLRWHGSERVA